MLRSVSEAIQAAPCFLLNQAKMTSRTVVKTIYMASILLCGTSCYAIFSPKSLILYHAAHLPFVGLTIGLPSLMISGYFMNKMKIEDDLRFAI
ncbi:MAG: hypothetical protein ACOYK9_03570 [Chlamydiia bacterium]